MPKTSVDDWSKTASNNQDVNNISILGSAVNSNVDNALREIMKQVAEFRDDMPARYFVDDVVSREVGATVKRIRVQYVDPDDEDAVGEMEIVRMSKADIDTDTIPEEAYWRSADRIMPDGSTDATNGGYWVNDTPVMKVKQFGTGYAAAQRALTHHALMGRTLDFGQGVTYTGTTASVLDIPDNSRLIGDAQFAFVDPDPTGTADGTTIVTIGDDVVAEKLVFSDPGGAAADISNYLVQIGNNPSIAHIEMTCSTQRARLGIYWEAEAVNGWLGKVVAVNVDRPLTVANVDADPITNPIPTNIADTQITIGDMDFTNFVTGFRPSFLNFLVTGYVNIRGRSEYSEKVPGANAILCQGCSRMDFQQPIYLANASEHALRVGNPATEEDPDEADENDTSYLHIPWMYVRDTGGCALKLTQKSNTFSEVVIGGITGTNVGCLTFGHGEEMVRLAKMDNIQIGPIYSFKTDGIFWDDWLRPEEYRNPIEESPEHWVPEDIDNSWPRAAVQMQDCSNFSIGPIYGTYRQQFVDFYGESDYGNTSPGPVEDGIIMIGNAVTEGGSGVRFYSSPPTNGDDEPIDPMTVGNIDIEFAGASGWTENLYAFGRAEPEHDFVEITGPVRMFGFIKGGVGPANDSDETTLGHEDIYINLDWLGKRRQGVGQALRRAADRVDQLDEIVADTENAFDSGDVGPTGIVLNHRLFTAGSGNYGMAAVEAMQLGAHRRGGAIVPKQTGSNAHNMGWEIWGGPAGGSSDQLRLLLALRHDGTLAAARLSTYASNAAALSGGLVAGDFYKTASGELRIVV
jgi:hypothetical protein